MKKIIFNRISSPNLISSAHSIILSTIKRSKKTRTSNLHDTINLKRKAEQQFPARNNVV